MMSIEILWDVKHVRYVEEPERPATILIKLDEANVDSADPAIGKVPAIKPAGVALIYVSQYKVIFDNQNLERIVFKNIRFCFGILFWGGYVLDGSWLLDGSVMLNSTVRYNLVLGLTNKFLGLIVSEQIAMQIVKFVARICAIEDIIVAYCMSSGMMIEENYKAKNLTIGLISKLQETISNVMVQTNTKDYWFLDGDYMLDGSKCLNSIYMQEVM